jgi:hypothetical protein
MQKTKQNIDTLAVQVLCKQIAAGGGGFLPAYLQGQKQDGLV